MASVDGALLGVNTRDSLDAVIAEVLKSRGQPDLILATGDLAQDGSEEAYRVLGDRLGVFDCGSAWLAGNHDHVEPLTKAAARHGADRRQIVDIGADWMREIGLRNREDFWQVIDRFPQVKVVLWGHIHQTHEQQRNGVQLLATPSTCIQFTSGSRKFSVEDLAPGYRWFELQASGNFTTEVGRALDFEFELDQNSSGY